MIEVNLDDIPEKCVEAIADLIDDHHMSDPNACHAVAVHCAYDGTPEDLSKLAGLLASQFTQTYKQLSLRVDRDSSPVALIYIQVSFA
jgi:hypothetical protein